MLSIILKDQYNKNRGQDIRKLYQDPVVSGCLFQSLNDFQKNILLRFIANQGRLSDKQMLKQINPNMSNQLKDIFLKLQQLYIIEYIKQQSSYRIYKGFITSLQRFILTPPKITGSELPSNYKNQMQQFDLLRLLYEGNPILSECKLTRIDWRSTEDGLTKQNFDYIRSPIYQKIGILIKGYLRYNKSKAQINDILRLSLLNPNRAYKILQKNQSVVRQLQSLKLLKRLNKEQFVISDYLHNFAFSNKRVFNQKKGSLKCKIIIQTNFKVYTQVNSDNPNNYQMIKSILKSLIQIQHEQYNFQELIVGSITQQKMKRLFKRRITSEQFFDFFQQYMQKTKQSEKDLGKWNKIKFLGLQGINNQSSIPNNVRQQIKLWENLQKYQDNFYGLNQEDKNFIQIDSDYQER